MSSISVLVGLTRLAADIAEAIDGSPLDGPNPSEVADRGMQILSQLVPVAQLRASLDKLDADSDDRITDIAEEAKLAVKKMGG